MRTIKFVLAVVISIALFTGPVFAGETLDVVKKRGHIIVGANGSVFGFSMPDKTGKWKGQIEGYNGVNSQPGRCPDDLLPSYWGIRRLLLGSHYHGGGSK